ncbi:hypothetical protein SD074_08160 [Prolixibacter sp. SD074]|nr:hypothetical protein SD074_08160 [Prolixibacter sp. SD074]
MFAPDWKVNDSVKYEATIEKDVKQGNFAWVGNYKNTEKFKVVEVNDSIYVVNWEADGFPINVFQDYPGPMYDWFQEWSKGKTLNIKIRFNRLGAPLSIINADSLRYFYTNMVDEFLVELPSRNVTPLSKDAVKESLMNLKNLLIPAKTFQKVFLGNLNILFPLYGKTFYKNQDKKITHYKTLSTMEFSIPIVIHTKLLKLPDNNYQLTSTQSPLPFDEWRIKPSGYTSIDFSYADSLDFIYNTKVFWLNHAVHKTDFERNNSKNNTVITYTKIN